MKLLPTGTTKKDFLARKQFKSCPTRRPRREKQQHRLTRLDFTNGP